MYEAYKRLYEKALSDETFREFLDADSKAALESIDIRPTPEILKGVEKVLEAIRELQKDFGVEPGAIKVAVS